MSFEKSSVILVTGAHGMVGRHLVRDLEAECEHVISVTREVCDLEDREATLAFFEDHHPDYVFHLAAKVGGIQANQLDPTGFLSSNARMGLNVLEAAHLHRVKKTLVLGSSCIYPRQCPQPMRESYLMTGPLEPTNEGYALSKLMTLKLGQFYQEQFGMQVVCPVPSNIYGPGDSFDLERSHVLSALVRRFVEARDKKKSSVTLWGTGKARREFVHVKDVVRAMRFCMQQITTPEIINIGPGQDLSIAELAEKISKATGFQGEVLWDHTKPDGMPAKCMDVSRARALGFETEISLDEGLKEVIAEFEALKKRGQL